MKHISELAEILNQHFKWNKARVACLAQMVRAVIAVRTVNLMQLALCFAAKAQAPSSYRRMQRFFKDFEFDPSIIINIILAIFPLEKRFKVIMDRTNWKFGKLHLNLLVLSIAHHGIAIPIYWKNLARGGSSSTDQRIFSMLKVLHKVGGNRISMLLADREFIGCEWFAWLIKNEINFSIRIKSNSLVKKELRDPYPIPVGCLFRRLRPERRTFLKTPFWMDDFPIFLSASRAMKGELLIVATPCFSRNSLRDYKRRWEIENLFSCLKTKGFNLEDTHLTEQKKVEKLLFVVVIAFCWAYLVGIENDQAQKIPRKSHYRKSRSLFRYGYDSLRQAFLQGVMKFRAFYRFLIPISDKKVGGLVHG